MLSVLIVDDEWIEREGIALLLKESPYEFRILMAQNGEEAIGILQQEKIDLLFTDIKMPFVDGMELLGQLRRRNREIKVAVFSAFSDFEYARNALNNQAFYYFLKPVDPDEFRKVLNEIMETIEKEGALEEEQENYLWKNFREKNGPLPEKLKKLLEQGENYCLVTADLESEKETAIAAFYEALMKEEQLCYGPVTDGEGRFWMLCPEEGALQSRMRMLLDACDIRQACVLWEQGIGTQEDFQKSYERMQERIQIHFFSEGNSFLEVGSAAADVKEAELLTTHIQEEINAGILRKDLVYVTENLELLQKELRQHTNNSHIYVKYLYAGMIERILSGREDWQEQFKDILNRLFEEKTLSGIHKMMLELINGLAQASAREGGGQEQKKVIRLVLEIVRERYQEDISLQSIAKEVYLSPSYLSYLFKKETGVSLVKYITVIRLDKAKSLLRTGNMKIAEIAALVGFRNYSYFNLIFKSNVGMSPAQYREEERNSSDLSELLQKNSDIKR